MTKVVPPKVTNRRGLRVWDVNMGQGHHQQAKPVAPQGLDGVQDQGPEQRQHTRADWQKGEGLRHTQQSLLVICGRGEGW